MEFIRISQHLFHSKGLKRQGLTLNEVEGYLLISPSPKSIPLTQRAS